MARTIRNLHPHSKRVRTFRGLVKPHQVRKMLDQPRGLYEGTGRGDAWGAEQIRTLKRIRTRRLRREGRNITIGE